MLKSEPVRHRNGKEFKELKKMMAGAEHMGGMGMRPATILCVSHCSCKPRGIRILTQGAKE